MLIYVAYYIPSKCILPVLRAQNLVILFVSVLCYLHDVLCCSVLIEKASCEGSIYIRRWQKSCKSLTNTEQNIVLSGSHMIFFSLLVIEALRVDGLEFKYSPPLNF
ncbi:uncharacterized protein RJT20DRAFT_10115 [Scheffersomyces xylosifermentans]|uniref:uncharacterized protein n=1 Tax=Scheffersomyces xylosifermentans TaxID=1304137 RepID=UPI00315DC8A3